jgi:hypothetical protein
VDALRKLATYQKTALVIVGARLVKIFMRRAGSTSASRRADDDT